MREKWAEKMAGKNFKEMLRLFAMSDSLHGFARLIKKEDYGNSSILRPLIANTDGVSDYYSINLEAMSLPDYVSNIPQCKRSFLTVMLDPFEQGEFKETYR